MKIINLIVIRLTAEINEVLGDRTAVTAEDVEKLQYTEQVSFPWQLIRH